MAQQVLVEQVLHAQVLTQNEDSMIIEVHKHPDTPENEHGEPVYVDLVFLERMHEQLQVYKPWAE